nr:GBF-interacting protein 1-like isoform X4 [Tanacetum cinerariifolium]
MVQQQAPLAQMYPQVHVPHYAMPFRQFLSPVYGPPMVMPSYSNNPTYSPHPSTGNSYVLMPGVNSPHVNANGLKYAIPQFKSIQGGSPTGFGNFTSPNGYTLNPGVVGSASGLDDSSRLKYKDGNIYVPNPQAETSELWMNPRDMP